MTTADDTEAVGAQYSPKCTSENEEVKENTRILITVSSLILRVFIWKK